MAEILTVIGPLFIVILIGVGASFSPKVYSTEPALSTFVLYFALPAFLFSAVASAPIEHGVPWEFVLIAFSVPAVTSVATFTIAHLVRGQVRSLAAPLSLAASYGNVGYLGVPITLSVLGPEAGLPAAIGQLVHNVMFMLGYPLIRSLFARSSDTVSARQQVWAAVKKALLLNPITISIVAGVVLALVDVDLQPAISQPVELFSQTAVPLAMFAVGLKLPSSLRGLREGSVPTTALLLTNFVKLITLPVLTIGAIVLFASDLDRNWVIGLVVMAAMPTSTTAYVLSQSEDADPRIVSSTIATSTSVALITIPVVLSFYN